MNSMASYSEQEFPETQVEVPIVEISSGSDDSIDDTEKEESPEPPATPESSIIDPKKRKNSFSSGKRKGKRIPCSVCNARFGSRANFDTHMELHWSDFNKMEDLLYRITNRILDKDLINSMCDCSQCRYKLNGCVRPEETFQEKMQFTCQICDMAFPTANKLSKHMEKHRASYNKMKELESINHVLFLNRPVPIN